jgi:hypothetical protein
LPSSPHWEPTTTTFAIDHPLPASQAPTCALGRLPIPGPDPRIKDDPASGKADSSFPALNTLSKQLISLRSSNAIDHLSAALRRRRGGGPAFARQSDDAGAVGARRTDAARTGFCNTGRTARMSEGFDRADSRKTFLSRVLQSADAIYVSACGAVSRR